MPFDGVTTHEQRTLADELVRARLRFARRMIAAGHWCQHQESDDAGNRCLVGWVRHSDQTGVHATLKLWLALPASARRSSHFRFCDVARYNDTHTRHSVIRLLDRAIVAMETM